MLFSSPTFWEVSFLSHCQSWLLNGYLFPSCISTSFVLPFSVHDFPPILLRKQQILPSQSLGLCTLIYSAFPLIMINYSLFCLKHHLTVHWVPYSLCYSRTLLLWLSYLSFSCKNQIYSIQLFALAYKHAIGSPCWSIQGSVLDSLLCLHPVPRTTSFISKAWYTIHMFITSTFSTSAVIFLWAPGPMCSQFLWTCVSIVPHLQIQPAVDHVLL